MSEPSTPTTELNRAAGPDAMLSTDVVGDEAPPATEVRMLRADARRNREAVLTAAKELFAERGLEAQMPDVAKAANVGVGTVYRHFPTKDHLIAALVSERFDRLAGNVQEGLEAADAWEGVAGGHGDSDIGGGKLRSEVTVDLLAGEADTLLPVDA